MTKHQEQQYWLMKTEPRAFSIDDLEHKRRESWDGVRNFQARNYMRDEMREGDGILFYHSSAEPVGVVGVAKVCSKPYPDCSAFDVKDHHYDPKSKKDKPTWYMVDVCFVKKFKQMITLGTLKNDPQFNDMLVTQRGSRLSIQPVSKKHYNAILKLGK